MDMIMYDPKKDFQRALRGSTATAACCATSRADHSVKDALSPAEEFCLACGFDFM